MTGRSLPANVGRELPPREGHVMICITCNGKGDTGPAYSPDSCTSCKGTGYDRIRCRYCGHTQCERRSGFPYCEVPEPSGMNDVEADADTLASAGMGTDEDYGYWGD